MQCTRCGVDTGEAAAFCPSCGARVGSGATSRAGTSGLPTNVASLICYLGGFITGILFLALDPYKHDRTIRFHAFQSIFLSVACVVLYFVLGGLYTILPLSLWSLTWLLYSALSAAILLLWVLLMYKAYSNQQFKVPIIGDLAAKQA